MADPASDRDPHDAAFGTKADDPREAASLTVLEDTRRQEPAAAPPGGPSQDSSAIPLPLDPPRRPGSMGRIGHYEVLNVVGRGGMGVVLRAFDEQLHRNVAIKLMSAQLISSDAARVRFIREARSAAGISHPNVVTIHAVAEQQGIPFLVMEYVDGLTLHDRIAADAPLEIADILRISSQICDGLTAAHRHGVVHRDIKPANVILENGIERAKITDFGLARLVMEHSDLTSMQNLVGTPAYMSPEQVAGEELDHRSDLFSLGSLIYAMVAGRSPFHGNSAIASARRVKDDPHRPLREVAPEVPEFLAAIVDRLLEKDPAKRFQSADEVGRALAGRLAEWNAKRTDEMTTLVLDPVRTRPTGGARAMLLLAVAAAVAGVAWLFWYANQRDGGTEAVADASIAGESDSPTAPGAAPARTWTVAATAKADFDSLAKAIDAAHAGDRIEVLDDADYVGHFHVSDPRLAGLQLVAKGGATLASPESGSVLTIGVPRVRVEGFRLRPAAWVHALSLTGDVTGCRLENLVIEQPGSSEWANMFLEDCHASAAEPLLLRKCRFRSAKFALHIGRSGAGPSVAHVRVEDSVFEVGTKQFKLDGNTAVTTPGIHVYFDGPAEDIRLERNVFRGGTGLRFGGAPCKVTADNNTFVSCERPLVPSPTGAAVVTARNNLFLDCGPPPADLPASWRLAANGWESKQGASQAAGGITVIADAGVPVRDAASAGSLVPAKNGWAARSGAGGDLPGHVGAYPP